MAARSSCVSSRPGDGARPDHVLLSLAAAVATSRLEELRAVLGGGRRFGWSGSSSAARDQSCKALREAGARALEGGGLGVEGVCCIHEHLLQLTILKPWQISTSRKGCCEPQLAQGCRTSAFVTKSSDTEAGSEARLDASRSCKLGPASLPWAALGGRPSTSSTWRRTIAKRCD